MRASTWRSSSSSSRCGSRRRGPCARARDHLLDTLSRVLALSRRELLVLVCGVRALAARRHAADLRVRRDSVLLLPAIALVRPRRLVRERVPVLLRSEHRPRRGLPRDVPRAAHRCRSPAELRDDRQRAPVEPVLRRRRPGDAGRGRARRRVLAALCGGGRATARPSTALSRSSSRSRRRAASRVRASSPASSSGSARRCSSTCTSRRPTRTHARRSPSRCSSRSGCRCASAGAWAAPSRSACPER